MSLLKEFELLMERGSTNMFAWRREEGPRQAAHFHVNTLAKCPHK